MRSPPRESNFESLGRSHSSPSLHGSQSNIDSKSPSFLLLVFELEQQNNSKSKTFEASHRSRQTEVEISRQEDGYMSYVVQVLCAVLLIFSFAGLVSFLLNVGLDNTNLDELLAGEVANIINNEALLAQRVSSGYSRSYFLPPVVDGSTYDLTLDTSSNIDLLINYRGGSYLFFLDAPLQNSCFITDFA